MNILALNPGGNSLKAELVQCRAEQRYAFEGRSLLSVSIEGIGSKTELSVLNGKEKATTEQIAAEDYEQAAGNFLKWLENHARGGQLPDDPPAEGRADRGDSARPDGGDGRLASRVARDRRAVHRRAGTSRRPAATASTTAAAGGHRSGRARRAHRRTPARRAAAAARRRRCQPRQGRPQRCRPRQQGSTSSP